MMAEYARSSQTESTFLQKLNKNAKKEKEEVKFCTLNPLLIGDIKCWWQFYGDIITVWHRKCHQHKTVPCRRYNLLLTFGFRYAKCQSVVTVIKVVEAETVEIAKWVGEVHSEVGGHGHEKNGHRCPCPRDEHDHGHGHGKFENRDTDIDT